MYQKIMEFAKMVNAVKPDNRTTRKLAAYLVLDQNGSFEGIDKVEDQKLSTEVPTLGKLLFSKTQGDVVSEKREAIFRELDPAMTAPKHTGFMEAMMTETVIPELKAVQSFLTNCETDDALLNKVNKELDDARISKITAVGFSVNGQKLETAKGIDEWVAGILAKKKAKKDDKIIISALTGQSGVSVSENGLPSIQNVGRSDVKAAFNIGGGLPLVSCDKSAFECYNFKGAQRCQILDDEAKQIVAGLEYLLNHPEHYDKNTQSLFFYDQDVENLIGEMFNISNDDLEEIKEDYDSHNILMKQILDSVISGSKFNVPEDQAKYYMFRLIAPSKGRFYLTTERNGYYTDLAKNLYQWYEDTKMPWYSVKVSENDGKTEKILVRHEYILSRVSPILDASISNVNTDKVSKAVDGELGSVKQELIDAMLEGKQIPKIFFDRAVNHIRTYMCKQSPTPREKGFLRIWLQIIKCYLKREGVNIMEEKTMEQRYKSAKNCGRLMALVERAKNVSSGSWNDGVMMNSYGEALCKKPADYIAKLQKHFWIYQAKLNTGKFIERMNELCQGIDIPELSNSFSTKEAACFYFGYIEEMNYWKEKKKDAKSEDAKSGTDEQKSS